VRRAALVATLPWSQDRHPGPDARGPGTHPRLGRRLPLRPRLVHPEGHRLVAAQPLPPRPGAGAGLPRRPGPRAQGLRPARGAEAALTLTSPHGSGRSRSRGPQHSAGRTPRA
jgi:hypothetical protein